MTLIFGKDCKIYSYAEFKENQNLHYTSTNYLFLKILSPNQIESLSNPQIQVIQAKQRDKILLMEGVTDYDALLKSIECDLLTSIGFINIKDYRSQD